MGSEHCLFHLSPFFFLLLLGEVCIYVFCPFPRYIKFETFSLIFLPCLHNWNMYIVFLFIAISVMDEIPKFVKMLSRDACRSNILVWTIMNYIVLYLLFQSWLSLHACFSFFVILGFRMFLRFSPRNMVIVFLQLLRLYCALVTPSGWIMIRKRVNFLVSKNCSLIFL